MIMYILLKFIVYFHIILNVIYYLIHNLYLYSIIYILYLLDIIICNDKLIISKSYINLPQT